jgi:SAM-dependent methyltransferase
LKNFAKYLTRQLPSNSALDSPETTELRKQIISSNRFLKKIYIEWYSMINAEISEFKSVLELGSGAGFFKSVNPNVTTSEILKLKDIDLEVDARHLPYGDLALDAVIMTDVLHHIPNVERFFSEAVRTLKPGGKIVMIEPWKNIWSTFIFTRFHHEPFRPADSWSIPETGPLSGANGALPWIILERDRKKFEEEYPNLKIKRVEVMMPFAYLFSGGVSHKNLVPGFLYQGIRLIEKPIENFFGMFAFIVITKEA